MPVMAGGILTIRYLSVVVYSSLFFCMSCFLIDLELKSFSEIG